MSIKSNFTLSFFLLLCALTTLQASEEQVTVEFNQHIRPLLSNKCFTCHGPDANKREAGLRLDLRESAIATLDSGVQAITPGVPEESEVWARINSADEFTRMPPAGHGDPLSANEKSLILNWIKQGAKYQTHWAFNSPERTPMPTVKQTRWPENPIDYYILRKLEQNGLSPSSPASKETLIRRLAFDLTGLPPSLSEIDRFLADQSDDAYQRLVEHYLASPAYGENLASVWLDLARYADTNGYQYDTERKHWVWRDWVIHAYNQNKSFDDFTKEQIAGDLIPDSTPEQILATGFNRNHGITIEGGVIGEEYRTEYVMDRLITTSSVWMGLTVGCARCHDHKYDPISQKEFYQLYAFFNLVPERGQSGFQPQMQINSPLASSRMQALTGRIQNLEASLPAAREDLSGLENWAKSIASSGNTWHVQKPDSAKSSGGTTITPQEDQSLLVSGVNPQKDIYTITYETTKTNITAIRLECLTHPSLPGGGPGRHTNSNFVLTGIELTSSPTNKPEKSQKVTFREAKADYNQANWHVSSALDPNTTTGWAVDGPTRKLPATAIFIAEKPFGFDAGTTLNLTLKHEASFGTHGIGRPRISLSTSDPKRLSFQGLDGAIVDAARVTPQKRTATQQQLLQEHYIANHGPAQAIQAELARLRQQQSQGFPQTMIMRDQPGIRTTHVLNRGQYNEPTDEVQAGTPAVLPGMDNQSPANRLGLANWLMSPQHPLTARVAVNRYWQMFFGNGLVKTAEDFGNQGALPSHPQLLDYLALEFQHSEWDIKHLHRLIVSSATYQQTSHVGRDKYIADPENLLLTRGPRMRLTAEQVRDNVLAVSGLLLNTVGGPSVYPYQPKGIWLELNNRPGYSRAYPQGTGKQLYRRSLYTFWKRTVPSPMMKTLDAPEREFCTLKRSLTNTPLQSLLLLNGIQFVEAARHMATAILHQPFESDSQRISHAFRVATGRHPDNTELELLLEAFQQQANDFQNDTESVTNLLSVGDSPVDTSLNAVELATWTALCRILLNLDESITKG